MVKRKNLSLTDIAQIGLDQCAYQGACSTGKWAKKDEDDKVLPYENQPEEARTSIDVGRVFWTDRMNLQADQTSFFQIGEFMQDFHNLRSPSNSDSLAREHYQRRLGLTLCERVQFYNRSRYPSSKFEFNVAVEASDLKIWEKDGALSPLREAHPEISFRFFYPDMLNGRFKNDKESENQSEDEGGFDFLKFYAGLVTLNYDAVVFEPHLRIEPEIGKPVRLIRNGGIEVALLCKEVDPEARVYVYFGEGDDAQSEIALSSQNIDICHSKEELVESLGNAAEESYREAGMLPSALTRSIMLGEKESILAALHSGVLISQAAEICYQSREHNNRGILEVVDPTLRVMDHLIYAVALDIDFRKVDPKIVLDCKTIEQHAVKCEKYELAALIKEPKSVPTAQTINFTN